MDFVRGGDIKRLRSFCSYDYYNISGTRVTMREWHAAFTPGEDALIQGINQGFPTAVTYAIYTCRRRRCWQTFWQRTLLYTTCQWEPMQATRT